MCWVPSGGSFDHVQVVSLWMQSAARGRLQVRLVLKDTKLRKVNINIRHAISYMTCKVNLVNKYIKAQNVCLTLGEDRPISIKGSFTHWKHQV